MQVEQVGVGLRRLADIEMSPELESAQRVGDLEGQHGGSDDVGSQQLVRRPRAVRPRVDERGRDR